MDEKEIIFMFFDSIIKNDTEKKIMKLVIDEKTPKEIIEKFLETKQEEE